MEAWSISHPFRDFIRDIFLKKYHYFFNLLSFIQQFTSEIFCGNVGASGFSLGNQAQTPPWYGLKDMLLKLILKLNWNTSHHKPIEGNILWSSCELASFTERLSRATDLQKEWALPLGLQVGLWFNRGEPLTSVSASNTTSVAYLRTG